MVPLSKGALADMLTDEWVVVGCGSGGKVNGKLSWAVERNSGRCGRVHPAAWRLAIQGGDVPPNLSATVADPQRPKTVG